MNDSAWTTLKFATVARKQQVTNVTMTSLARLANAVVADPRDAFTKLRYVDGAGWLLGGMGWTEDEW